MKQILFPLFAAVGLSAAQDRTVPPDVEPKATPLATFKVGVTAPATNYKIEIKGVYKVGEEVWVVSKVATVGDIGGQAITKVTDSVKIEATDLPDGAYVVRHKVLGKSWNWDEKGDGVEHVKKADEAEFKKKLAGGKKIPFKR